MKEMLGADYPDFEECMTQPHLRGIRVNTLKFDPRDIDKLGLPLRPCPFSPAGFYLDAPDVSIGHSPWHHAGAFYSQEPSAMSAVTVLDSQPGERILDMCAAPGGKSTQIAAALQGHGLLWSNEYVRKRAQILLANMERMGVRNAVISNTRPDTLADQLEGFFDRVLVDAPCSGEGMFRRDETAIAEWSPEHSAACAVRQRAILDSAARCVRPGGVLVYSTCTFSFCENEDTAAAFLESHPEFDIVDCGVTFGRPGFDRSDRYDLTRSRRIFPMDGGEGHFVAKFQKQGEDVSPFSAAPAAPTARPTDGEKQAAQLFAQCFSVAPYGTVRQIGNCCYLLPQELPDTKGLGVLRGGVLIGEILKNRIEPAHALFMAVQRDECVHCISLSPDSPEWEKLQKFLHGEEIDIPSDIKGYAAVACGDTVTGFGKASGGRLKNKYPKGLRTMIY